MFALGHLAWHPLRVATPRTQDSLLEQAFFGIGLVRSHTPELGGHLLRALPRAFITNRADPGANYNFILGQLRFRLLYCQGIIGSDPGDLLAD